MNVEKLEFNTIKEEASKYGYVKEWRLRQFLKEGKLPGYWAGSRFYINHLKFMEWLLDGESDVCAKS